MPKNSRLAIVICTYNRSRMLIETLKSLYASGYSGPDSIDIIVVINHCKDDTLAQLELFKAHHSQDVLTLKWLEEPRLGKSFALNAAIAQTDQQYLCFIDDDQIIKTGFIDHLLHGIIQYPNDSIFCGRIWPAWDGSEPSWVHAEEPYKIPIRPFPEFDLGPTSLQLRSHDRLPSGGNITVSRQVFAQIGCFSTELGPTGHNLAGGEDHDLLKRATNRGYAVRYLPDVRQLHAIDAERMGAEYILRKSYFRSCAHFQINFNKSGLRLYMIRKIVVHLGRVLVASNADHRFLHLVRLAASLGEFFGALDLARNRLAKRLRWFLPPDHSQYLIAFLALATSASGLVAWVASGTEHWAGLLPALAVAGVGTVALLAKSLLDFSQTGPRIRAEVLVHYRGYTLFALVRLSVWVFVLMLFASGGGILAYYALNVSLNGTWSPWLALLAAALGIVGASTLQFLRKLRFNPGLLVASLHYRVSRLYPLWRWTTTSRLRLLQGLLGLAAVLLTFTASWGLVERHRTTELVALWSAILFYIGTVLWTGWQPEARAPRRVTTRPSNMPPNILLIGSDTLRADHLGALGYNRALTPHLDALATQGTLFANCYVPCARTAPSLMSLLTGTWPYHHGIRDNYVSDSETQIKVATLPQLLKPLGYRTAVVSDWCGADMGKFSFGFDCTDLPEDQWNLKYLIRQGPKDLRLFLSLFANNRFGRLCLPEIYYLGGVPLTTQLGRRARWFISRLATESRPFLLNVFYSTTHPPFASEWPWYTRFAEPTYAGESKFAMARLTDPFEIIRRQGAPKAEFDLDQIIDLYDGCVAQFDDEVGRLLRHVEDCGLASHTIIVVYSDHGMEFFEHETWGQGNSVLGDHSPRVPVIIVDPRRSGRHRIRAITRTVDIAPTLLELVGQPVPPAMGGVSLAACLAGTPPPELVAYNESGIWFTDLPGTPTDHLRYPDLFELLDVPDRRTGTLAVKTIYRDLIVMAKDRMVRRGRWMLTYHPLNDGVLYYLFDLENDPGCWSDVSASYPRVVAELKKQLDHWLQADGPAS